MAGCRTLQDVLGLGAGVRVNRDSPQARGLVHLWHPQATNGAVSLRDIAKNVVNTTAASAPYAKITEVGRSFGYSEGGSSSAFTATVDTGKFGASATFACWIRTNDISQFNGMMNFETNGSTNHYPFIGGNVYNGIFRSSTRPNCGASLVDLTKFHLLTVTTDGTNWTIYQNSAQLYQTAADASVSMPSTGRIGSNNFDYYGDVGWVGLWNRALTPAEVWSLYDPRTRYDLFWRRSKTYSFKAPAAGGGFLPAWAYGHNFGSGFTSC